MQDSVLIIHSDKKVRERIEGLLQGHGIVCICCRSATETKQVLQEVKPFVVVAASDELKSGAFSEISMHLRATTQVVALLKNESELHEFTFDAHGLFCVLNVNASTDFQIGLALQRAFDHAVALEAQETPAGRASRSLFNSIESLQSAGSLSVLLDIACREIAANTGFRKATIVLGNEKNRIQNISFYSQHETVHTLRERVIGQPLYPYVTQTDVLPIGAGLSFSSARPQAEGQMQAIVIPIERDGGVVYGFVTLEDPINEKADIESLSWPIAKLLKLVSFLIETQRLRADYRNRNMDSESALIERNTELRMAQERFSRLVSLTEDIIYMTDAYGRLTYLNDSFSQSLGYVRENFIGQSIHKVISELSNENEQSKQLVETLESHSKDRFTQEIEIFTKSGYRRSFRITHHWIRQGGDIVAGQGLMRDVTEPNELRNRLARSERFEIAGKLATGVAHEINNPLQAISSHLAGIAGSINSDSSAATSMDIVSDSVERIRLLTRSMMDLQRSESLARSIESMNTVVEKSIALMGPQLRNCNIEVRVEAEPDLPKCRVNAGEISQVLINLILNAIDAMPSGGNLTITTVSDDKNVIVKVADTGKGIPPDVLESLFQPFMSFREQGGGLGMGLYMSQNIIRQHGGSLEVESPPGRGAVFTITLPIANN